MTVNTNARLSSAYLILDSKERHGLVRGAEDSKEREVGRSASLGQELRWQTGLSSVRRPLHLCHAQPRQMLQIALVLPPRMVSL